MNEVQFVDWLRRSAGRSDGRIIAGIGADCAIFRPRAYEDLLFTTDQLIEGVHFLPAMPAARVGERALARSLSDIAAMGGDPRFCLVSLATPRAGSWTRQFFRGLLNIARRYRITLAGGDLA